MITRILTAILITLTTMTAATAVAETKNERHNPYTVLGLQLRSQLTVQSPEVQAMSGGSASASLIPPTLFQEIVPCRLVTTHDADAYPAQWGPSAYKPRETRSYHATGVLVDGDFVNPCSERIPDEAIALSVRLEAKQTLDNGTLWIAHHPAMPLVQNADGMDEANVMLQGGKFSLTADASTHLTVDVIGFFVPDPNGYGGVGAKGDKGEKGEPGERGAQGEQGLRGDKGEQGERGAQGEQGLRGDKGEQGERGAQGEQGLRGDKGEQGERGAQGLKGDKGDQGEKGAQGERGEQGLKGDKGDRGENGAKGDKGENGAKGDKGDRGENGAKGDKGNDGAQGPQGPQGSQGPMGPMGPQGPKGDTGPGISMITGTRTFPPPGQITINDPAITSSSVIILIYTEVSNGNALGVASQRNGSFVATGSPNKPFRYVIFNAQ
jgi:hypothetical protein